MSRFCTIHEKQVAALVQSVLWNDYWLSNHGYTSLYDEPGMVLLRLSLA